jgi:hypothetical protein
MKNKRNILLLIILIAAAGIFWLAKGGRQTSESITNKGNKNQETQEDQQSILASTSTISQTDSFYNIKANYPQFANASQEFNDKIKNLILDKIDVFKKDAKDAWEARKATAAPGEIIPDNPEAPFEFIAGWEQTRFDEKYISFSLTIYYFSGGAHGITEVDAFNYDIKNKKEITINDFLGNSSQNLEKLSQLARQQVILQLQSNDMQIEGFLEQMIDDGTKPNLDNYKNFNFDSNSLIIYFQQYQVAPGSAGQITITLDKNMLKENSIESFYLN